ncbi:MAG: hypothetical protein IPJ18_11320 [Betaproteobacteria bacterium]|jgi:hypothetical protein|nr:hypothetical protein [Betaproteobacteria bacterium]
MNRRPYSPAEFNALMDEAKVRAAQMRREAMNAWGARLWRWCLRAVHGLRDRMTEPSAGTPTTSTPRTPPCLT